MGSRFRDSSLNDGKDPAAILNDGKDPAAMGAKELMDPGIIPREKGWQRGSDVEIGPRFEVHCWEHFHETVKTAGEEMIESSTWKKRGKLLRDDRGRFAKGNRGGPGRKRREQLEREDERGPAFFTTGGSIDPYYLGDKEGK